MGARPLLSRAQILAAFDRMSALLVERNLKADLFVVGGAAMMLAYDARPTTRDIDAVFKRKSEVLKAAGQVAREQRLPDEWLSNAVTKFVGRPDQQPMPILDLPGLRVMAGSPRYMLAMKILADRHDRDRDDLRFLIRLLGLKTMPSVERAFREVYPAETIAPDTRSRLKEILAALRTLMRT